MDCPTSTYWPGALMVLACVLTGSREHVPARFHVPFAQSAAAFTFRSVAQIRADGALARGWRCEASEFAAVAIAGATLLGCGAAKTSARDGQSPPGSLDASSELEGVELATSTTATPPPQRAPLIVGGPNSVRVRGVKRMESKPRVEQPPRRGRIGGVVENTI